MPIDFDRDRWDNVRETYRRWWKGELDRPIIPVELLGRDPGRPQPDVPLLSQATCADLSIPAEAILDRIDYELSRRVYLGDAFPLMGLDAFGPGILGAMLGARLDNRTGQVWFHPPDDRPITDIQFQFNPNDRWLARIRDLAAVAVKRWQGQVLVATPDLGGNLDILATFRPGERLHFDLVDHPEEVRRLTWEAHDCWHRVFAAVNEVLQPLNPGYSDWAGIYYERPGYMLQCDFGYMIGPAMFDDFARPELQATCRKLAHTLYHLDGPGQLAHLDSLLRIPELDGVQWVPGAGRPTCENWPEVYRKIHKAGKKIQVIDGGLDTIAAIARQLGDCRGIHRLVFQAPIAEEAAIRRRLAGFGIR